MAQGAGAARLALAAAVVWVAGVAAYGVGLAAGGVADAVALAMLAAAAAAPLLAGLACAAVLREIAALREQLPQAGIEARLSARLAAIESGLGAVNAAASPTPTPTPEQAPKPAQLTDAADAPAPSLPFADADAAPVRWSAIVRALDFPRDPHDAEGYAAVREAVRDGETARLLQAAEDVLGLLSAADLHMEDLRPERPPDLAAWRAYAAGARGPAADAVGGVRDPAALARAQGLARRDAVFRDAALMLSQRWGRFVARMARELGDDPLILKAADSRTGRAFMLLSRAMGAFD